ncbi:MAG: hypothetical protein OXF01_13175 [Gemmatimonadetes bacterium]|nr:hypothetical protein [Gemmatimonadota bacterium]
MKKLIMKKLIAIAVAAVFIVALAPPAFAMADPAPSPEECTDASAMLHYDSDRLLRAHPHQQPC